MIMVPKRYYLDKINVKALLVILSVTKGFIGRVIIDVSETPFYVPTECPVRLDEVIEAIKKELTVDGVKVVVNVCNQMITIDGVYDSNSGVPIESLVDLDDEDDEDEDGMEVCDLDDEEGYDEYDEWDAYSETFDEYVCRIVEDEDYHMEVYEDILPDGSGEEYRNS